MEALAAHARPIDASADGEAATAGAVFVVAPCPSKPNVTVTRAIQLASAVPGAVVGDAELLLTSLAPVTVKAHARAVF